MYGPSQTCAAPIRNLQGEFLTDDEAINKRWAEYFEKLINKSSTVDQSAVEEIPMRPQKENLDIAPTEEEVREAIEEMQCGKAAGPDSIPPEIFKAGDDPMVEKLICMCWKDGYLAHDLKDIRMVHFYKCKGDKSSCDNLRIQSSDPGVEITYRSVGGIFKINRSKAKTKITKAII